MDDFYIVIPSNISSIDDEPNKISHFRCHLPRSLTLDKALWRVALIEIDYHYTWNNISGDVACLDIKTVNLTTKTLLSNGLYTTPKQLVDAINETLQSYEMRSKLTISNGGRCKFDIAYLERIQLHPTMSGILGFEETTFKSFFAPTEQEPEPHRIYSAKYPADTNASFYSIYVYSNIIEDTLVGNTYVPLLQTVPIKTGRRGKLIHHEYLLPQYLKLQTGTLSSIEIKLCDESGNPVRFEKGHVIAKLHFKKEKDGTN